MDTQRIEQTSLEVQLQLMPPEQRRAELLARLRRMALRGQLRPGDLATHDEGVSEEAPGASPPPGLGAPLLDPTSASTPKNENSGMRTQRGAGKGVGDADQELEGELRDQPAEQDDGGGDEAGVLTRVANSGDQAGR